MAKRKKNAHPKKQRSAQKAEKPVEKANPFDLKVHRKKHDIVGQKSRLQSGSKSAKKLKVNEKRKDFFKKVYLHRNKANNFIDKRIGEYDEEMVDEDRVLARIAANQRKKQKKRLYNLNDDFDLTHGGQPISTLETFDDVPKSDDDDDDSELDADFVSEAHFGGFMTEKDSSTPKTRKEILNDFISETKIRKQEKKEAKEVTDNLTSELDAEWKQIHYLLPDAKTQESVKGQCDPFDMTVRELRFAPRGTPAVSTKVDMLENQRQMKKLKEEREFRMQGEAMKMIHSSFSIEAIENDFEMPSKTIDTEKNDLSEDDSNCDNSSLPPNDFSDDSDLVENSSLKEKCSIPQTLDTLLDLLSNLMPDEISQKLDSLVSECRFKENGNNIKISQTFFLVLLEYLDFNFKDNFDNIKFYEVIAPRLYGLAQKSPVDSGEIFRGFFFGKIDYYNKRKQKKNSRLFNILIILKLCGHMYSTSDFHHPIAMPAMILMSDILNFPGLVEIPSIACRIFVCSLMYEYVSYSKRFVPEAVNYLFCVLVLATDQESSLFNYVKKCNLKILNAKKILQITSSSDDWEPISSPLEWLKDICSNMNQTSNILTIIHHTIFLLYKFAKLYKNLPIFTELFQPASDLASYLPIKFYPKSIVTMIQELKTFVTEEKSIQRLSFSNKKPKLRKLFTPKFEDFSGKKPATILEQTRVHKQLSKKIKKEEKGLIRDLRRDAEFVAREQLQEKIEADTERKRKVKELYAQLATQEGEYKKFAKKK